MHVYVSKPTWLVHAVLVNFSLTCSAVVVGYHGREPAGRCYIIALRHRSQLYHATCN